MCPGFRMIDQLIVFQKLYDLFVYTHRLVAKFPKSQRFLLSNYFLQTNIEMIRLTIIANRKKDREKEQEQISVNLDLFRIYTRLAKDINFISVKKYELMMKKINEIGKLLNAWKRTTKF